MTKPTASIPIKLIPDLEAWGQLTARLFGALRIRHGLQPRILPAEQAWFWTVEWQAVEKQVDAELENGDFDDFETVDDLLADLHDPA